MVDRKPDAILIPGDIQYDEGTYAEFMKVYDPTWGRVKSIIRPAPGNHEYRTKGAAGYYEYFGSLAGPRGKGWYSFDLGNWHLVSLNSECYFTAGCSAEQEQWLAADLAKNNKTCTLAYWHHPRFSSGEHRSKAQVSNLWKMMYDNKVELVLNGHDHNYERFAPVNASGDKDPVNGVREMVVGTGGKGFRPFTKVIANSEVRDNSGSPGVTFLTLRPGGYDWKFEPIPVFRFTDSGSGRCR